MPDYEQFPIPQWRKDLDAHKESKPESVVNSLYKSRPKKYRKPKYSLTAIPGACFGKLTVIEEAPQRGVQRYWRCRCECGREHIAQADHIRRGKTKTCGGCRGHKGMSHLPEFHVWRNMITRCTDPRDSQWTNYGGRGIKVCARWLNDFRAFLADIGPRPAPRMSIDRLDNNQGYWPSNCQWATASQQMRNTRRSPKYSHTSDHYMI